MGNQHPFLPPLPLNSDRPGDDPSEFGVDIDHSKRLARKRISPEDGGPYPAIAPGKARFAGRPSGYPGERLRG